MARVTDLEVEEIIEVDSSLSLTAFITAANLLIDDELPITTMDTDLLKEIERWLAAHFVAIRVKQTSQEKTGEAAETFESKVDLGLDLTRYGQQAKLLDTSGSLAGLDSRKTRATINLIDPITTTS